MKLISIPLLLLCFCNPANAAPLKVFVSILPQQYLLEQIGGEQIEAHVMVTSGYAPATYDPLPQQLQTLSSTNLYFAVGHLGFELAWLDKIRALNPQLKVILADDDIDLVKIETKAQHHADHAHLYDPHIWLDPQLALNMAALMRDQLSQAMPEYQAFYAQNYQSLAERLNALDVQLQTELKPLKNRRFMVFHPAWGYFARRYGLEQIALSPIGKTPSPQDLIEMIDTAKRYEIKRIFVQKQFSQHMAKTVAQSIDGKVIAADPLTYNYIDNLKTIAHLFTSTE